MRRYWRKAGQLAAITLVIMLVVSLFIATPVLAQGVGLSGNFYRQHFELSPGETLPAGEDVYVVVSNPGDSSLRVKMITQAPLGVTLLLSQDDFTLDPEGEQKVNINVQVSQQAVPGEYTITISAEAQREGGGIKVTAGVEQEAALSILGESGRVIISSVTDEGDSFPALIGVYQQVDGELTEVRPPQKGKLEARLTPGDYIAQAQYQDIKLAEESFSLAADEEKEITLEISTIVFESFSVVPNYEETTKKPTSVGIAYAINNLYEPVSDVEVVLKVMRDDEPLDEISLTSMGKLGVDRIELSYNYIPTSGWKDGSYGFKLELLLSGKVYTTSPEEKLDVGQSSGMEGISLPSNISWPVLGAIAGGIVLIVLLIILLARRRTGY